MRVKYPRGRTPFKFAVAGLCLAVLAVACGDDGTVEDAGTDAEDVEEETSDENEEEATGGDDAAGADFEERELIFGTYVPQSVAFSVVLEEMFADVTETTGGSVTFDSHFDGSLYNATEIRDAVLDGRLDIAHVSAAYYPNQFPLTTASHIPFVSDNMPAQMAAFNELYESDDQYRAEFEDQGLMLLSFMGVPAGIVTAPDPIDSIDYFQGVSNRASADFVTALQAIDADDIVTLQTSELYEALQRGLADTVVGFTLDVAAALSLQELNPYFVDVGAGLWADTMLLMSVDTWESFSPELQAVMEEAIATIPENLAEVTTEREVAACEQLLETGGTPIALPDAEVERWANAAEQPLLENWSGRASGAGVADPEAFYAAYVDAMERLEQEFDYSSGIELCIQQAGG